MANMTPSDGYFFGNNFPDSYAERFVNKFSIYNHKMNITTIIILFNKSVGNYIYEN